MENKKSRIVRFLLTISLFSFGLPGFAQRSAEKFYFKNEAYEFRDFKVFIERNVATKDYFRTNVIFTNTSDKFMLMNAADLFVRITGLDENFENDDPQRKHLIIPPGQTKGFTIKFLLADFRKEALEMSFKKIQFTDKLETVYEFPDVNIYTDSIEKAGPVSWSVKKFVRDDMDANVRIDGILKYTGNKFLVISYDQIVLKTKDGKTYNCNNEPGKSIGWVQNKPYYDNVKKHKKIIITFPLKTSEVMGDTESALSFKGVFKEYSLVNLDELRLHLVRGTEKDYKEAKGDIITDEE